VGSCSTKKREELCIQYFWKKPLEIAGVIGQILRWILGKFVCGQNPRVQWRVMCTRSGISGFIKGGEFVDSLSGIGL
jgi:hypothetical protein